MCVMMVIGAWWWRYTVYGVAEEEGVCFCVCVCVRACVCGVQCESLVERFPEPTCTQRDHGSSAR